MRNFKFVDLFSGIGGFHQAMATFGGQCVFASDIDECCNKQYMRNYNIDSDHNICDVNADDIPDHDVLCAGFPCQSFSKAGHQAGFKDSTRGTLFFEITRILERKHPKYIILENVRNIVSHDCGNTWKVIQGRLRELGYRRTSEPLIVSPHQFGIPQIRERAIILGKYEPERVDEPLVVNFGYTIKKEHNSIYDVLDSKNIDNRYNITEYEKMILTAWDEFYQGINKKVIGFPVWAEFFKYDGDFDGMPSWKQDFIHKNVALYEDNRKFIDQWLKKYDNLKEFAPTHRKFEWQCGTGISSIWEGVIQLRPSGVRVKLPNNFQALVAMVQIPIVGKYKRRLTVKEAARLQSFPVDNQQHIFLPDDDIHQAYKQFGNSVNVEVIRRTAEQLFLN